MHRYLLPKFETTGATMTAMLAAGGSILTPSLITILLFVALFAVLNIREKGRWD